MSAPESNAASEPATGGIDSAPIKSQLAEDRKAPPHEGRPNRGDRIELTIDSFAHGGAGVARTDTGYVVFVTGAIPGDRVLAEIGKRKRSFAEARTVELLEPSPDRVEPRGDHPGAPWQVLTYERQLTEKAAQVRDAMVRLGGFDAPPMRDILPAVEQWRYRNKIEFSFAPDPDAEGGIACGFHPPGEWWRVVDVDDFVLASERMNQARAQVVAWAREHRIPAFDRKTRTGFLRNLVIREGKRSGQLQVRLVVAHGAKKAIDLDSLIDAVDCTGLLLTSTEATAEITHGGETVVLAGHERLEEELHGITYRISAEAFFQTNTLMAEELYSLVRDAAALEGWERLVDLYCGIGTIGLTLAPRAAELWGIESIPQAIDDAMEVAQREGYKDRASFVVGDVRVALPALLERGFKPDVAVVDPPRAGLSQKVVRRIVDAAPKRLVYVSCNPTTMAPNARQLVDAGYELKSVQPVDMFPQTPHVEAVAVFERGPGGVRNPDRD
jgi:23S rRNA (uracil1939-C5)-methyltransferase